jgi:predicted CoA-binding protein
MSLESQAAAFLDQKRIAVVGVSRKRGTGNAIAGALRKRGYQVFPVNPRAKEVDGETCYPDVKSIPGGVTAAVLVTRPEVARQVVDDCAEAGVGHLWMHHNALFGAGSSSVSEDAVQACRRHGIDVIPGACPLMFGDQADLGHKCMRWLLRVGRRLP